MRRRLMLKIGLAGFIGVVILRRLMSLVASKTEEIRMDQMYAAFFETNVEDVVAMFREMEWTVREDGSIMRNGATVGNVSNFTTVPANCMNALKTRLREEVPSKED